MLVSAGGYLGGATPTYGQLVSVVPTSLDNFTAMFDANILSYLPRCLLGPPKKSTPKTRRVDLRERVVGWILWKMDYLVYFP